MPIQTPAFKLTCPSCGWTKLYPTMGDVRYPGQVRDKCPTCGIENLKQVQPNFAEKMIANVLKKR
jgi:predicted nucleic-acid-binding Zn-ribbon protein